MIIAVYVLITKSREFGFAAVLLKSLTLRCISAAASEWRDNIRLGDLPLIEGQVSCFLCAGKGAQSMRYRLGLNERLDISVACSSLGVMRVQTLGTVAERPLQRAKSSAQAGLLGLGRVQMRWDGIGS